MAEEHTHKITKEHYKRFFPFPEIREPQERAIDFILNAFKTNRFVILEAGTGVGKSAIGVTVSRYLQNNVTLTNIEDENKQTTSYFLTPQKILQKQYIEDFGFSKLKNKNKQKGIRGISKTSGQGEIGDIEDLFSEQDTYFMNSISSSTNYRCKDDITMSCADRMRLSKIKGGGDAKFKKCRNCIYRHKKDHFKQETDGVTNMQYFLSETTYVGELKKRQLLVIDEAHNCDTELSNFINITITDPFLEGLGLTFPDKNEMNETTAKPWIEKSLKPVLV